MWAQPGGTTEHPPGQLSILAQVGGCAQCPPAAPGVPRPPHSPAGHGWSGSSCAQGPAPAHWGLLAATRASHGGWRDPSCQHPAPPCVPRAAPTSLAPLVPPVHPHRGPVDEPVRLLLAVDDDAVALPPLLGRPAHAKAAGRCWHPACPGTQGCSGPGGSPGAMPALTGAAPAPASPQSPTCG